MGRGRDQRRRAQGLMFDEGQPIDPPDSGEPPPEEPADWQPTKEPSQYWAAKPKEELPALLMQKERNWSDAVVQSGLAARWRVSHAVYHGLDPYTGRPVTDNIQVGGTQGQNVRVSLNEYRSYVRKSNTMTIGERPAFKGYATNADVRSQKQAQLSDAFVQYVYEHHAGEAREAEVVETDGAYGAGYGHTYWDQHEGEMVEQEEPITGPDGSPVPPIPQTDANGQPVVGPDGMPSTKPATRTVSIRTGAPKTARVYPWDAI